MKLQFKDKEVIDTIVIEEALTEGRSPFKMSKWSLKSGLKSPVDVHDVKEYWIIVQGKGQLNYNDESMIDVQKGDCLFFESNKSHQVENTGDEDLLVNSFWW